MDVNVLVKKGENRKSNRSFNTKGSSNIISNGSIIAVNEGQCMIIVEQGAIVEVCAQAGEFVFDKSTEPSIFYGGLGEGVKKSFDTFMKRVTMGGDTGKDQRVYFFNTKDIIGNKYGTASPIPFRVIDKNISLDEIINSRGYRILGTINKVTKKDIEMLVAEFTEIQAILMATAEEMTQVKGISKLKAEHINKALIRLRNRVMLDRY